MYGFNFELDDFQKEAINFIQEGKSVVVCAPTGAGKTVIAQSAIHLALENNQRIFYTTPLKALSNQKFYDFSRQYGESRVGLLTGDTSVNRDAQIVVMTTEVFRNMLYGTTFGTVRDNLKDVKYVVLDEVHYMNDEQRGTVWEESIIYCPVNIQIIALSATVQNSKQLTDWINSVHSGTELVYTDFRPVPLKFYYYDSSKPYEILPLLTPNGQLNSKIKPESKYKHFSRKKPQNPVAKITSVLNERDMLPAIYFTFSRKKCDENAKKCVGLDLLTKEEMLEAQAIIDEYIKENPYLENNEQIELLQNGVASHHAGLLPSWKVLVERLFQKGLIKMVFATETLAAGINMPARTTVISSISKRGDNGHRLLTANEFLQMSGRAGRRGMDKIGYVVIVGTPFQTPIEVAALATAGANPLESKFSPGYSMVLNLLQRFSIEDAKELILKTFGYFSSTDRTAPLVKELEFYKEKINDVKNYPCPYHHKTEDMLEFIKWKNMFVEARTIAKTLKKQAGKKGMSKEAIDFIQKSKELRKNMEKFRCDNCKSYQKHKKELEISERYLKKIKKLEKDIDFQKDIYWQKFLAHKDILEQTGNIKDDFPTEKGKVPMALRAENELYISEIILRGLLDDLTPVELASVMCAVSSEENRNLDEYSSIPPCKNVRKTLGKIKDIRRQINFLEHEHNVENAMNLNSQFCSLIELWTSKNIEGEDKSSEIWDTLFSENDFSQGDVVRAFKRTIDILRQITILENVNLNLVENAKIAIKAINMEPVNIE